MDSIGDYLVIIFFALSFLSSILKKKKKANSNDVTPEAKRNARNLEKAPKKKNALEVFLNAIEEEKLKESKPVSEVDLFFEEAMKKSKQEDAVIEKNYNQSKPSPLIPENNSIKKAKKETIKSYSESIKLNNARHQSGRALKITNLLKQKDSIKQFLIINEILGKPKALQR